MRRRWSEEVAMWRGVGGGIALDFLEYVDWKRILTFYQSYDSCLEVTLELWRFGIRLTILVLLHWSPDEVILHCPHTRAARQRGKQFVNGKYQTLKGAFAYPNTYSPR